MKSDRGGQKYMAGFLLLLLALTPATCGQLTGTGNLLAGTGLGGIGNDPNNINALLGSILAGLFPQPGVTAGNTGATGVIDTGAAALGGVAGSLALLAAALKAPLVALYSISAEVVVMVALILFISYIASLLGIDDFKKRSGVAADARSVFSDIWNSEFVSDMSDRVTNAIENFDLKDVLENLDTRF